VRQSESRPRHRPIRLCNPYFDTGAALSDLAEAASMVDGFDLAPLDVERVDVGMSVRRGVTTDVLVGASAPRRVRAGGRLAVRLAIRRRRGGRRSLVVRVPVPAGLRRGRHTLVLSGSGSEEPFDEGLPLELVDALDGAEAAGGEPHTMRQLARRVASLRRPLGIEARLERGGRRLVHRSHEIRFEGRVEIRPRVLRARR